MKRQYFLLFMLALAVLLADQFSKYWAEHVLGWYRVVEILPVFNFSLAHNYGAAFGFLNDAGGWQTVFFTTLALLVSVVLLVFIYQTQVHERLLRLAYTFIIAGALGNAIDRLHYGYVVDFIHWFYQDWHFPNFNIADMSIFIGAALMIAEAFGFALLNSKNQHENITR